MSIKSTVADNLPVKKEDTSMFSNSGEWMNPDESLFFSNAMFIIVFSYFPKN